MSEPPSTEGPATGDSTPPAKKAATPPAKKTAKKTATPPAKKTAKKAATKTVPADSDDAAEKVDRFAIWLTVAIVAVAVVLANAALAITYVHDVRTDDVLRDWRIPWQPIVSAALAVTSLVTFGGFYIAARRARIAITASFLLTFLVMLPFALTIPQLGVGASQAGTEALAKALVDQFTGVVGTVIVFYFGSEAAITGIKLWATAQKPDAAEELATADRDLPPKSRSSAKP